MSTNGMESWAVDLKDFGAIYPFQGSEVLLVIVGLAFWIGWHVIQIAPGECRNRVRHGRGPQRRRDQKGSRPLFVTVDPVPGAGRQAPLALV